MIDKLHLLYAVYGMAIMFHFMMAWLFIYRRQSRVRILLCTLMTLIGVNYIKDLFFLGNPSNVEGVYSVYSPLIASIDMSALPFFVLVLIELCFARFLNIFKAAVIVAPFALCITLFQTTLSSRAYFLLFAMSIVYSILAIILVLWRLPVYRRLIQQEYSTVNEVHFHWTYYILVCFVFMLITWVVRTITQNFYADCLYIFASVVGWVLVSMFLVRIESLVRSIIQCGFDDTEDFHMFLQEKAIRTFSPSLSDFTSDSSHHSTSTDEESTDNKESADSIVSADFADADSPSDVADTNCNETDCSESEGLTDISTADRRIYEDLSKRIKVLFDEDKIYLDPELRLSTLALQLGTNRTYMSNYFNQYCGTSFYDYVNKYRLEHSKHLLTDSDYTYEVIASMSGFNSLSTFRRAFQQMCGCSPKQWRMGEISPPPSQWEILKFRLLRL